MKDYIEMFLGTSGNGNAIYSSVKRVMTKFGPMYQGTPKGTKIGLPWCISITEGDDDKTFAENLKINYEEDAVESSHFYSHVKNQDIHHNSYFH